MTECAFDAAGMCQACGRPGRIGPDGRPARRLCRPRPDLQPAAEKLGVTLADVVHYASALTRWTLAGLPTRPPDQVAAIHAQHCQPCPENRAGRCARCGCRVAAEGLAVVNKIRMGTESCPLGKW